MLSHLNVSKNPKSCLRRIQTMYAFTIYAMQTTLSLCGFRVSTKCGPRSCDFRLDCAASWLLSHVAALACRSVIMVMVVVCCCCIFHRALPLLRIRAIVCSPLASLLLLLLLNYESQDLVHSH